jgi:hypothetical protein
MGTAPNGGEDLNWAYDESNDQLVVGRPAGNVVACYSVNNSSPIPGPHDSQVGSSELSGSVR